MKFKEFDSKMRVFEEAHDHCVLPGVWMVARLDGRNFTELTKSGTQFTRPFDENFHDAMVQTCDWIMQCGFRAIYCYTQSDEISLLLSRSDKTFDRKLRKLLSILPSEAAAVFSHVLGIPAAFDCRISQLPRNEDVIDYFRWRRSDAFRNARNAYVYWGLRDEGLSPKAADKKAAAMGYEGKTKWLGEKGIFIEALPGWQTHGMGFAWLIQAIIGIDPRDGSEHVAERRRITEIPTNVHGDTYASMIESLLYTDEAT